MSLLPSGPVASFLGVGEERQGRVPRPQPLWIFPPTADSLYCLSPTKAQAELAALSRPNPWNHSTYLNSAQRKRGFAGGTGSLPCWPGERCRLSCVPSLVPSLVLTFLISSLMKSASLIFYALKLGEGARFVIMRKQ